MACVCGAAIPALQLSRGNGISWSEALRYRMSPLIGVPRSRLVSGFLRPRFRIIPEWQSTLHCPADKDQDRNDRRELGLAKCARLIRLVLLRMTSIFEDLYAYAPGLHWSDSVRLPRARVQLGLANRPENSHWKIADSNVESTCSSLPISSKRTSSVAQNAFYYRSAKREPEMVIRTGFRHNKLLIVVRRLNALRKKLHRISTS